MISIYSSASIALRFTSANYFNLLKAEKETYQHSKAHDLFSELVPSRLSEFTEPDRIIGYPGLLRVLVFNSKH
jgi:hypothetical protein